MRSLIKGFVFRIIFTAAGFLISLLIAKFAGANRFGVLSLMIVNAALIQIITGLGTDAAIVWHGITGREGDRDKIFSFTFYSILLQLLLFILSAVIFFKCTGRTILSGGNGIQFFYIELLYFAGLIFTEKYSSLFYSQQLSALCNKLLAVVSVTLVLVFFLCLYFSPGIIVHNPEWIFSLFIFIPAVALVSFYHSQFSPLIKKISKNDTKSFINFSFIVLVGNLIQFIAYRVDFWFIDYFHGKEDVGIYAQASRFSQILWIIPGVMAGLIIPALKSEKNKLSVNELVVVCRLLFYTHIALAGIVIAGSYILYSFFLPGNFSSGFLALLLMLPGYLFFTITTVLASFFSANRLLRINLLGSSICCVVMLALDMLLIPKLSFTGAAIANLVTYTITTVFFILAIRKQTGVALSDYFDIRKSDFKMVWTKLNESKKANI